MKYKSKDFR